MNPDVALIVCRFLHDMAAMLVWGGAAYLAVLVPRRLASEVARHLAQPGLVAIAVAVATTAAALPIEAALLGDGWRDALRPEGLSGFLLETAAGTAWMVQAALALLLLAMLTLQGRDRRKGIAIVSAALLASIALTGHAVMHDGRLGMVQRLNDALHVLSAGAWLGALVPLVTILRALSLPALAADAATALRRFSVAGHIAVALAILTGAANTLFIVGHPPTDWSSPYQALLAAKIAVVGVMVALALANRYTLMPRMDGEAVAVTALRRGTIFEIALGVAAIALVAVFGTLDPAPV